MILTDQPKCFDKSVISAVSSNDDGQMQLGWREPNQEVERNRQLFLCSNNLDAKSAVLVKVKYQEAMTYDKIMKVKEAAHNSGALTEIPADCLVTSKKGIALFLPVADCIATIVHDPKRQVLALAHLGRHSTVANLAEKLVTHINKGYGSKPHDLTVWMSPSIQAPKYVLERATFANDLDWQPYCTAVEGGFSIDMQGYNKSRFIAAGISAGNITISHINTATNKHYWSHYTTTTVKRNLPPPRFAVVCSLA